jgi:hypothetical protein
LNDVKHVTGTDVTRLEQDIHVAMNLEQMLGNAEMPPRFQFTAELMVQRGDTEMRGNEILVEIQRAFEGLQRLCCLADFAEMVPSM